MHVLALAILLAPRFISKQCGVALTPPPGWTARANDECDVELQPARWSSKVKQTGWDVSGPPLKLVLYERGMTFEQALEAADFEYDGDKREPGHYFMEGGYGSRAEAEPYVAGAYSGLAARTFSRLFKRDGAIRG